MGLQFQEFFVLLMFTHMKIKNTNLDIGTSLMEAEQKMSNMESLQISSQETIVCLINTTQLITLTPTQRDMSLFLS